MTTIIGVPDKKPKHTCPHCGARTLSYKYRRFFGRESKFLGCRTCNWSMEVRNDGR